MARSAWLPLGLVSLSVSALLSGCVVTSSPDTDGGVNFGGNAGQATGGSGTGGGATGGSATGGTGGATTGGTGGTATGGSGGQAAIACTVGATTPLAACDTSVADACLKCLATNCCDAYKVCFGTNPGDRCSIGGPTGQGEFQCMRDCTANPTKYKGCETELPQTEQAQACCGGGPCSTPSCTDSTVGDSTGNLMTCINDVSKGSPCSTECGFL